jgi:hypothetical protein
MTVGKKSCIAPGVAVGSGAGASVSGKGDEVFSKGIVSVAFGMILVTNAVMALGVGEVKISWTVGTGPDVGSHPDRMINVTGRRRHKWFMVYRSGGALAWK